VQSKLTKAAKGQECTIQLYPYCNGNPETTVFCHAPSEDKGTSIKSPDFWGADGCSDCHDIVDGRRNVDIDAHEIYVCFMRGVYRTIKRRIEKGLIKI
jgi:hypothetical protein